MRRLILDFDNTCVNTEILYTTAKNDYAQAVVEYAEKNLHSAELLTPETVFAGFSAYDTLQASQGAFHIDRFSQSMLTYAAQLLGYNFLPTLFQEKLWAIGQQPFTKIAEPITGIGSFLAGFHQANIPVTILTKGDTAVQEQRIQDFPFRYLLNDVKIVPKKSAAVLDALLREKGLFADEAWVVGDSPKDDTLPALELGCHAALLVRESSWTYDHAALPEDRAVFRSRSLLDIRDYILEITKDFGI